MQVRLRPVADGDRDDVRAMAEAFHGEDGHPIDARGEAAVLIFDLGLANVWAWAALCGSRTVGYVVATLRTELGDAEIEKLYAILENRKAVARAILGEVCEALADLGARRILVALAQSDRAGRFYYRCHGFETGDPGYAIRSMP